MSEFEITGERCEICEAHDRENPICQRCEQFEDECECEQGFQRRGWNDIGHRRDEG